VVLSGQGGEKAHEGGRKRMVKEVLCESRELASDRARTEGTGRKSMFNLCTERSKGAGGRITPREILLQLERSNMFQRAWSRRKGVELCEGGDVSGGKAIGERGKNRFFTFPSGTSHDEKTPATRSDEKS